MAIATGLLWLGWLWVVISINPFETNWLGFVFFYFTLFLALFGTFTLLGVWFRKLKVPETMFFHLVVLSARQGFFLGTIALVLLIFQSQRWLDLISLSIIVFIAAMIEFFNLRRMPSTKPPKFEEKEVAEPDPYQIVDTVPPVFEKREL